MVKIGALLAVMVSLSMAAVNINTATLAQLETLSGIGPTKAQAILQYRKEHGSFKSVNELDNVKGIGMKTVQKIKPQLMTR
ncbi:MAG: helix-hairpin-helix domain-containing protein [Sulfuricurvum sp.]|jgi:competence protein ComEA